MNNSTTNYIDEAIAIIDKEAEESTDTNIKLIAQIMIEAVGKSESIAQGFLTTNKTIKDAFAKVRSAAQKTNGAISDEDGYKIMFEFFGIKGLRVRTRLIVEDEPQETEKPQRLNFADFLS